jgi:hypothetical protein
MFALMGVQQARDMTLVRWVTPSWRSVYRGGPHWGSVDEEWGSRPLPKFMVGPNAINGRQRRLPCPTQTARACETIGP